MLSGLGVIWRNHKGRLAAATVALLALAGPNAAFAGAEVTVSAALDRDILIAGEKQRAYLRIAVTTARRTSSARALMNVALVIDRSGSMASQGRMANARRAAEMAVDRLGRDDILSIVSYDNRVDVDVPATKVLDRSDVRDRIARLTPRGSTAIHAALLAAANEVRKFKSRDRVNRIVLISDGLANVGPRRPQDFIELGRELASEGITVSTIGLGNGYNEDLMAGLARAADGGHVFVQESADLTAFLGREFDDLQGTVGQEVEIIIKVRDGVRPIRSLGRNAEIRGSEIVYKVGALFGGTEQVLLVEVEVDGASAGAQRDIADVVVTYHDATTGDRRSANTSTRVGFADDRERSEKSVNAAVLRDVTTLRSRAARQEAVRLRDAGRTDEALRKFKANAEYVRQQQARVPGAASYAPLNDELKASVEAAAPVAQTRDGWSKARKAQRAYDSNKFGSSQKY